MATQNIQPNTFWPQQSPIALFHDDAVYAPFPPGYLTLDYSGAPYPGQFRDAGGHWNFVLDPLKKGTKPPRLTLGDATAELKKVHLHTPSEHDLEGKDQAGEIHLIHEILSPTAGSTLVVLGVFFATGGTKRTPPLGDAIKQIAFFQQWEAEGRRRKQPGNGGTPLPPFALDPRVLLPETDRWFRYEGSLTTEPYTEVVSWVVFQAPLTVSSDTLKRLKVGAHQPERDTQPVNRRFVLRNF